MALSQGLKVTDPAVSGGPAPSAPGSGSLLAPR